MDARKRTSPASGWAAVDPDLLLESPLARRGPSSEVGRRFIFSTCVAFWGEDCLSTLDLRLWLGSFLVACSARRTGPPKIVDLRLCCADTLGLNTQLLLECVSGLE